MSMMEIANQVKDYCQIIMDKDRTYQKEYGYVHRGIRDELMWAREELRQWLMRARYT